MVIQRLRQVGFDVINDRLGWVTAARITLQILLGERAINSQSDDAVEPMRRSTVRGALPWEGKDRNMRSLLVHAKAAKAVITPKGAWTKRARQRGNAHCALGAIEEVLGLVPETAELDERSAALIIALARELGVREYTAYRPASSGYFSKLCYVVHCAAVVMKHNDARTTTQRKVLRLFERVIARLEAEAKHRSSGQQVRQLLNRAITKPIQPLENVAA